MSLALVKQKIAEAVTAQEAGDFATALTKLRSAKMLLATVPTRSRQGESEVAFEREQLDSLMLEIQKQQNASLGIQRTKIEYKRASD